MKFFFLNSLNIYTKEYWIDIFHSNKQNEKVDKKVMKDVNRASLNKPIKRETLNRGKKFKGTFCFHRNSFKCQHLLAKSKRPNNFYLYIPYTQQILKYKSTVKLGKMTVRTYNEKN